MGSSKVDEEEVEWSRPHFFKIMSGDFSQRLEIPEEFVKRIFWELTPKATLTSSNGSTWRVDVKREGSGTYFTHGWLKFVDDNSVQRNDFLLFRYDGDMQFMVMLFDKTACEKDEFVHKHCRGETEKLGQKSTHGRHDNFSAKSDKGYGRKHVKAEETSSDFEDIHQKKQSHGHFNQSGSLHGSSGQKRPMANSGVKFKEEPDPIQPTRPAVSKIKTSVPKYSGKQEASTSRVPSFTKQILLHNVTKSAYFVKGSQLQMWLQKMEMIPSVWFLCAQNFSQEIPKDFSNTYLPRQSMDMVLQDPKDRKWKVRYISTEKDFFSSGWSDFRRHNKLKDGDFCKFELVSEWVMNVHIMRA